MKLVIVTYWLCSLIHSSPSVESSLGLCFPWAGILQFSTLSWDLEFRWYLLWDLDYLRKGLWERVPGDDSYSASLNCIVMHVWSFTCLLFLSFFYFAYQHSVFTCLFSLRTCPVMVIPCDLHLLAIMNSVTVLVGVISVFNYCILFLALFLSSYLCSVLITICDNNHTRKCHINLRTSIYWQNSMGISVLI